MIIIPLGGIGKRFKDAKFDLPKALIKIHNKPLIYYLIDNLDLLDNDLIYIPYNKEYVKYNLEEMLIDNYPKIKFKFLILENNTSGPAETIYIALSKLNSYDDCPILSLDCDTWYTSNIIKKWNYTNSVFTSINTNLDPIYSYVTLYDNQIIDIKEKDKISDYACTGAYGFNSWKTLLHYCNKIIINNDRQKNEFYISGAIRSMLVDGVKFDNLLIDNLNLFCAGTPNELFNIINMFDNDIWKLLNKNFKNVTIDYTKLKGGNIANVINFHSESENLILKYEETKVNEMSIMANQLELYDREYYFYTDISQYVNVKIPTFIKLVKSGIVLENLNIDNFKLNLDLNKNIDISLTIIDKIANMHSLFWNKDLKKQFPKLYKHNDEIFNPFMTNFINSNYEKFKVNWKNIITNDQFKILDEIITNFSSIQNSLSNNNLTFIHGDVKSANIFYDTSNNNEPYFLDWQHCAIGKGVQDVIFLLFDSIDVANIKLYFTIYKYYYYKKLTEFGISDYLIKEYEIDILNSIKYVPVFVCIWFGSCDSEYLAENKFVYFWIKKLFILLDPIGHGI